MSQLLAPLTSVDAYVAHFSQQPLPVLRHTVRALDALRAEPDQVSARQISTIVLSDPLLTMRLLTHIESHRPPSQNRDITTIERAVMMMGVEPFLRQFDALPTVEDSLKAHPRALVGVLKLIARARRVADLAREFAVMRHDLNVQEITVAALLYEATSIVCWIYAPSLTEKVIALQAADRQLRTVAAQRQVFGVTAGEIQLELIRAWCLPGLLVQLLDESLQDDARVRTVILAARLARHLAHGWDDAGLPDDLTDLEALLHVPREVLLKRLGAPEDAYARLLPATPEQ